MARQKASELVSQLRFVNSHPRSLTVCLEPWGEIYKFPPDSAFDIVGRGPKGGSLEVEMVDEMITVYGWAGSVVELIQDGVVLGQGSGPKTPVPPGVPAISTRETMRRLGLR